MHTNNNTAKNAEILNTRDFITRALGVFGVESALELEPREKARILEAFHLERCDDDWIRWLGGLDLSKMQAEQVHHILVARSSEMRTVASILIGHECSGTDFEGIETLMS